MTPGTWHISINPHDMNSCQSTGSKSLKPTLPLYHGLMYVHFLQNPPDLFIMHMRRGVFFS